MDLLCKLEELCELKLSQLLGWHARKHRLHPLLFYLLESLIHLVEAVLHAALSVENYVGTTLFGCLHARLRGIQAARGVACAVDGGTT